MVRDRVNVTLVYRRLNSDCDARKMDGEHLLLRVNFAM
jgi:hypothetical protein